MSKIYKVHPGIGIARVGDSRDRFYVGPEVPGGAPVEIGPGGEAPLEHYKHDGKIKRQAARFRVFEYERDDGTGEVTLLREITSDDAVIRWTVQVANTKNGAMPIVPEPRSIVGVSAPPVEIAGRTGIGPIKLGDLRTDGKGRLLFLGGHGKGRYEGNGAQNYDDTCDGWVKADVELHGGAPQAAAPAWVVSASPDYFPGLGFYVSLFDVCHQIAKDNGWVRPPERPSFKTDILPILQRAAGLRWVHKARDWSDPDLARFRELGRPDVPVTVRKKVHDLLRRGGGLSNTKLTEVQDEMLKKWVEGVFIPDQETADAPLQPVPGNLERAALELTTSQFGPGIETGRKIKTVKYAEPFRLALDPETPPGSLTKELQIFPWHYDYAACRDRWWPSQRPDVVPGGRPWLRPNMNGGQMLDGWSKLGFVLPKPGHPDEYEERERTLPDTED